MYAVRLRLAVSLILLTAAFWLAPSELRASCGDYLQMSGHVQSLEPSQRQQPQPPCRGPLCCAQTPLPSVPPTTSVTVVDPRDVVFRLAYFELAEPARLRFACPDTELVDHLLIGRLFRPPRIL